MIAGCPPFGLLMRSLSRLLLHVTRLAGSAVARVTLPVPAPVAGSAASQSVHQTAPQSSTARRRPCAPGLAMLATWLCWVALPAGAGSCRALPSETVGSTQTAGAAAPAPASATDTATANDSRAGAEAALADWVARAQLPADVAASTAPFCSGAYVEPETITGRPDGLINADADVAEYLIGGDINLLGDVVFSYKNSRMSTQRANFVAATQRVELSGQVLYRQPGLLIQGENASMVLEPQTASVDNASFVLHEGRARGRAERVEQQADGSLLLRDGVLTRCEPGDDTWSLSTASVYIDPERRFATARNAVLRVEGVPVVYVPYFKFPVSDDRASGFLFPSIGRSGDNGFDVSVPYYLNLAPNYDMTLTPRYLSDRGALLEAEARYRSENTDNVFGAAYLPQDDNYNGQLNRQEFKDIGATGRFRPDSRWLITLNHRGELGAFESSIDYAAVSDLDYFVDLGTDLSVASKSQLERRGMLSYSNEGFKAQLSALRVQPLQFKLVEPYQRLPELALGYKGQFGSLPLSYRIAADWARFDRATDNLSGVDQFTGSRMHLEPRLMLPLRNSYSHLDTTLAYRYTRYHLQANEQGLDLNPERGVGLATVDAGLTFERNTSLFGSAATQTLEPRVFYLWSQRDEQDALPLFDSARLTFDYAQLFRENRFTGRDRIADANQLSVALTSRYLDAQTGVERVRASFGRILNFSPRKVDIEAADVDEGGHSPWAGEVAAELAPGLGLRASWVWDARQRVEDSGRLELHYQPKQRFDGDQRILHVGYSRQGSSIRQTDVSGFWPVSKNLRLIGRWYYDVDNGHSLETFAGVELDACCYQVRVLARRYLRNSVDSLSSEPARGIFIQFVLKGLAGFGGGVDRVLENGIPGYREDGYEQQQAQRGAFR